MQFSKPLLPPTCPAGRRITPPPAAECGRTARDRCGLEHGLKRGAPAADLAQVYGRMTCNQAVELAPHDAKVCTRVREDFQAVEDAFAKTVVREQADGSVTNARTARRLARFLGRRCKACR